MRTELIQLDGANFLIGDKKVMPQWKHPTDKHRFGAPWSKLQCDVIDKYLGRDDTFIDIGANWGGFLFIAARRTRAKCYGYEPDPRNFDILHKNCGSMSNVEIHQCALGNAVSTVPLYLIPHNVGGSFVEDNPKDGLNFVTVPIERLDDRRIDAKIIKLDVEGYGLEVFYGGIRTFKDAEIVMVELHLPNRLDKINQSRGEEQLPSLFKNMGFHTYGVGNEGFIASKIHIHIEADYIKSIDETKQ